MKELLALLSLVAIVLAEEAPYAPSGWKPSGPAFELPQRQPQNTQYLPPLDPRNPTLAPEDSDVSVQGLPTLEQQPIFQVSPINGQQYVGAAFNADIQALDESFRQSQYQIQQQKAREFARQRALDAQSNNANRAPNQQSPRQFGPTTTKSTDNTFTTPKYNQDATTELNLNEGEIVNDNKEKEKVTVEVTKQKVQEFPPELFLSPLTQQIQSQLIPLEQFARFTSPLYFQQIQEAQKSNEQAILAAAILSQRQILQPAITEAVQNPVYLASKDQASPVFVQTVNPQVGQPAFNQAPLFTQPQAAFNQAPAFNQPGFNQFQPNIQYQPQFPVNGQYEPLVQPQVNQFPNQQAQGNDQQEARNEDQSKDRPQFVYQQVYQQPQDVYQQPPQVNQQADQQVYQQPQLVYQQPQQVNQQPQQVYQQVDQQVYQQPQLVYQQPQQVNQQPQQVYQQVYQQPEQVDQRPQLVYQQPQQIYQQVYQPNQDQFLLSQSNQDLNRFYQLGQNQVQGSQDSLQSGINDQQGNDLDESEKDENEDTNVSAVATATAFGTRTQPRPLVRYGPPVTTPDQDITTTEPPTEVITEQVPVIAEATAVANGRRKSAKLRNRRVRPVFTLDRSGHLVLAQEQ